MKKQNNAMELYRFVSAVLILCYHCQWFAFRDISTAFSGYYVFVELFFILSGFLMMGAIRRHVTGEERRDPAGLTARYMKKRLARLVPHHLLSWALVALIRLFLTRDVFPIEVLRAGWPELLFLNIFGFVRDQHINIVCWYLSAMVFACLILHYLVLRDEDGFVKVIAPVLLAVCYGTLYDRIGSLAATIHFARFAPHMGFMRALGDITVGILAYRAYEWLGDVTLPGETGLATALEGAVFLACGVGLFRGGGRLDFLFVPLFFAFVISVFRGRSLWTGLFDNRLSGWLGRQSYAFFLNNLVVILPYMHFFPESTVGAMAWFCAPVCLILSVITGALVKKLTR